MQIDQAARGDALERLDVLVGEWSMEASFPDATRGRTVFEWLPGGRILVQRWEVPHPDAPDGIAVIRFDPDSETWDGTSWERDFDLTYTKVI